MKFIPLFLVCFLVCQPAVTAAEANEKSAEKALEASEMPPGKNMPANAGEHQDGVYECKYYTVNLPDGWTAIMPPTDQLGTVNAIFATTAGSSVVTMIIGPNGGADAQTIADMFAEQFKAPKPPVLTNGQYVFYFPLQKNNAQAIIASSGDEFMVTTIAGNMQLARNFLKNAVKSERWKALFPK